MVKDYSQSCPMFTLHQLAAKGFPIVYLPTDHKSWYDIDYYKIKIAIQYKYPPVGANDGV